MATYGQLIQFGPYPSSGQFTTAKVYHYIVGTTTLKDVYVDREKASTAAQPVVSDANGIVSFYADGIYKFRIDVSTDGSTYSTLYTYDKWSVTDTGSQTGEGAALTAASTLVLGTDGDFFHVTGSTGITAISGTQARVTLVFDGTPILTNSGVLILQNSTSLTMTAGDVMVFQNEGAGVWRETSRLLALNPAFSGVGNPIINGVMDVWQRGTAFAAMANGAFSADRWGYQSVGAGVITINRSTNVPTVSQAGMLFNYSLEVDVTTADASLAATDIYAVYQKIEGYNWRQFAQRILILSFWASSTKTGIHSVSLQNSGANQSYVGEFTINASDTWEYKTVVVAASPSGGTWDYTSGVGIVLKFILAAGSNFTTTSLSTWNADALIGSTNQVNAMDNSANFFRLTGVKLEVGSSATPIQFRSFNEELALCKRYFQKSFVYATAPAQNVGVVGVAAWTSPVTATGGIGRIPVAFSPSMRITPTCTTYNPSVTNAQARNAGTTTDDTSTTMSGAVVSEGFGSISFVVDAGNTAGNQHNVHWSADAEL